MKGKKLVSLLLAGTLAVSFTTVAYADSEESSRTLSILSWNNESTMQPLMDAFLEANPDVTLDFQYAPPIKDYVEKLSTLLYSDSAPDVFCIGTENRRDLIEGGYVMDISGESYMKDGIIPENAQEHFGKDDAVYGIVLDAWVGGLYVNDRMLEEAGVEADPQTWDEFLEVLGKLQEAGFKPIEDGMQDNVANIPNTLFAAEVKSKDPSFTEKVYEGTATFEEGWTEPVKMWYQLIEEGYLTSDMVGVTADQQVSDFATEQVAMIVTGPWNEATIESINPELKYHIMGIPGKEEGNVWYPGSLNFGYAINEKAKDVETAKAFLSFLATKEAQDIIQETSSFMIIADGYENKLKPCNEQAAQAISNGRYYNSSADWTQYAEAIQTAFSTTLQEVQIGQAQPEDVGKNMDAKLAELLNN